MKKSFIIHCDSLSILEQLTDEQCGKLFRKMKSYHNGNNYDPKDVVVHVAFEQFKNQFDRDLIKYENICERNRLNGARGGRPKKPSGLSGNPNKPKKADSDNDSDNDSDKDNIKFNEFWNLYPNKKGKDRSITKFKHILKKKEATSAEIMKGLKIFIEYHKVKETERRYIPYCSTRLNQARRKDDYSQDIIEIKSKGPKNIIQENQDYSTRSDLQSK